jgi:hypothetical protein
MAEEPPRQLDRYTLLAVARYLRSHRVDTAGGEYRIVVRKDGEPLSLGDQLLAKVIENGVFRYGLDERPRLGARSDRQWAEDIWAALLDQGKDLSDIKIDRIYAALVPIVRKIRQGDD